MIVPTPELVIVYFPPLSAWFPGFCVPATLKVPPPVDVSRRFWTTGAILESLLLIVAAAKVPGNSVGV